MAATDFRAGLTVERPTFGRQSAPAVQNDRLFLSRRTQIWTGLRVLAFFGLCGVVTVPEFFRWLLGGPVPETNVVVGAVASIAFVNFGLMLLASAALRLPKLHVTSTGVVLEGLFFSKWADYGSISPLGLRATYGGSQGKATYSAVATVVGESVHPGLLRRKKLIIPDFFQTPLTDIIGEINRRQARVLGPKRAGSGWVEQVDDTVYGVPGYRAAWLSSGLIVILVAVFAAEQFLAGGGFDARHFDVHRPIGVQALVALGGLSRSLVIFHLQWYRLLTAMVLHISASHLIANSVGLFIAGNRLERLVGREWFMALFLLSGLGGSLMSLALNPANMVSVGASGAIMGLYAALLVLSFRLPNGSPQRTRAQSRAILTIVLTMAPTAAPSGGVHVDVGAHLGGALTGALIGFALLRAWRDDQPLPPDRRSALTISAFGILGLAAGAGFLATSYLAEHGYWQP
jgi:membrane associated rhomboid family serine protease